MRLKLEIIQFLQETGTCAYIFKFILVIVEFQCDELLQVSNCTVGGAAQVTTFELLQLAGRRLQAHVDLLF